MRMIVDLEDTVGWIGCGITTCFFVPQLTPFIKILQKKLYFEDAPGFFISICYSNCFLWMIYGDMIFSDPVRITNMIACFICFIAMMIYLIYETKKYLIDSILNFLIIFMASWSVYKYLSIEIDDDKVVGNLAICSSIIVHLYFSYTIYKVIKEKNFMLINFTPTAIYFVSSLLWLAYGVITKDLYMVIPNSMGVVISLIEIIIYINYEKKYPAISTVDVEGNTNEEIKKEESEIKNIEDNKSEDPKEEPEPEPQPVNIINQNDN
jgi:solute carrier family 50 protein (sugar transporter)